MKGTRRIGLVHAALALLGLAVIVRAAQVQLVQGSQWGSMARRQQIAVHEIPAPRGAILDAGGRTLVSTRDVVKLEVAPREVRDRVALRKALIAAKVDVAWAARAVDRDRAWVVIPGRYLAEDVARLASMRGVYATPASDRAYAMSEGLRPLLGRVQNGNGVDGLELTLDSLLRGVKGETQLARGLKGRDITSPGQPSQEATPGHSVMLTINQELQEIAERTLADAVARLGAEGGDIVILDPRGGEVLAMAGQRNGVAAPSATAVTEPFEPGSTIKPLVAAALLERGRVRPQDVVPTRGGKYLLHGRTIHDEPHDGAPTPAWLTLADVIRFSSNIGIAQFADRLAPREQFETLRDFGLGMPTGIPYSSEAAGTLRPPVAWSKQSQASLAMGYELATTPLQLALAYAAIANGGELLEPMLVKEIRAPDGDVKFKGERRVVRRVLDPEVARNVLTLLTGVVARGTAVDADMATFSLAGKTGTPRRTVGGKYAPRQYNPNFVGVFPADAPQLVIVVKLVNPKSSIYGGTTAAPMTKTIVQAALAARDAALNRSALATPIRVPAPTRAERRTAAATAASPGPAERRTAVLDSAPSVVLDLVKRTETKKPTRVARAVPDVRGLTLRAAVRTLHRAGFRVALSRAGTKSDTEPTRGVMTPPGALVRLRFGR